MRLGRKFDRTIYLAVTVKIQTFPCSASHCDTSCKLILEKQFQMRQKVCSYASIVPDSQDQDLVYFDFEAQ